ncbi:MAG: biotin--[acetyl-CoA-carboxylase] ligase [Lachnospiraceae bacterium]|nr:biotin--[acetyl-CoA-carboxylase] ligase [Lachnospiraceae bacterium]
MRSDAKTDRATILALLAERRDFVTGVELSRHFGVSRTAVHKHIKKLIEDGYAIESQKGRGYLLRPGQGDAFSGDGISILLDTKWAGRNLLFKDTTGSTNRDVMDLAEDGAPHGTVVAAGHQSAGRGRKGRSWQSPVGSTVSFSILLRPDYAPDTAPMVTIVMAMAVMRALKKVTGLETAVKWPNDVLINGKKVCGILTEMNVQGSSIRYVVIGVGVNVNIEKAEDFPEEIREKATSLYLETGEKVSRSRVTAECCNAFEELYDIFSRDLDLRSLTEEYNSLLVSAGKPVRVLDPKGEYTGISGGIDRLGQLSVKREDGETVRVSGGEVSVRGIYGYV